ncbi:MAG: HD family phosphohydrolase [Flavobacteriaceae bacterium]
MKSIFEFFYNYQSSIFKGILYTISVLIIVYLLPIKNQFAFEFTEGQSWGYETLYAPFDFAIIKSEAEILIEQERLKKEAITYFDLDEEVVKKVKTSYASKFQNYFTLEKDSPAYERFRNYGLDLLSKIYINGVLPVNYDHQGGEKAALVFNRSEKVLPYRALFDLNKLSVYFDDNIAEEYREFTTTFYNLFFEILEPNLSYNEKYNNQSLEALYSEISPTRGLVAQGEIIIVTNELIEGNKWDKLRSLKQQFSSENLKTNNYGWNIFGYTLIVALLLLMLLLFIHKYRPEIYENNTKMTFIFFNLIVMIGLSTIIVAFDPAYIYALPICIFPLITKAFFDSRLGLFVHVLSILIIGFIVPSSFEYVVLQVLAGIVTTLSVSELYKRANLFVSVFEITLVYLLGYLSFFMIRSGDLQTLDLFVFGLFLINGLLTLFVQPLIYFYEKLFNLVSDVSLLELSDTNSAVFKMLSNNAPGTFHHSLQVANLAEAAAYAINANVLLTRVGALYHDIGKNNHPTYFSENQRGRVSPHDDLSPKESARIIIRHVLDGIELAKKYKLPDRIIDFIRTHHGTSKVYYFYKKQQELNQDFDLSDFTYNGPKPFSKETAIVMMVDSVEAASKSLKEPTIEVLEEFVTKIIDQQMEDNQFVDSNITLSEIEIVKKVLINKLVNIYHLRVEYPE